MPNAGGVVKAEIEQPDEPMSDDEQVRIVLNYEHILFGFRADFD